MKSPRIVLTDDDRRKICNFHEQNPTVKEKEIGGEPPFLRMPLEMSLTNPSYIRNVQCTDKVTKNHQETKAVFTNIHD